MNNMKKLILALAVVAVAIAGTVVLTQHNNASAKVDAQPQVD